MMGLDTFNLFSFENYYNNNVSNYFQKVGVQGNYYDVFEQVDFTEWLEYFTEGIINELLRVQKIMTTKQNSEVRLEPYHRNIIEFIKKNGSITNREYEKITKRAKATRALDFKKLTKLGIIEKKGRGKATYYKLRSN